LIQVDVRIVSTSNRNMAEAIEEKVFREDLYYRLNVVPINLPPLRDRRDDIMPLAEYFLEKFCIENHKPAKIFDERANRKILDYPWPGNIRELANIVERAVVMDYDQTIAAEHLVLNTCEPASEGTSHSGLPEGLDLQELEKRYILKTLQEQEANRTRTAELLGISIRTLRNKLNEYRQSGEEIV